MRSLPAAADEDAAVAAAAAAEVAAAAEAAAEPEPPTAEPAVVPGCQICFEAYGSVRPSLTSF